MQPNASSKWFLILGSINMFLAVALGVFGTHTLKTSLPTDMMAVYHTGNRYYFYHALGLFAVAAAACFRPSRLSCLSGAFILVGLILFSGSLYVLSVTGQRWVGMVTSFGGSAIMIGWLLLAAGIWRSHKP